LDQHTIKTRMVQKKALLIQKCHPILEPFLILFINKFITMLHCWNSLGVFTKKLGLKIYVNVPFKIKKLFDSNSLILYFYEVVRTFVSIYEVVWTFVSKKKTQKSRQSYYECCNLRILSVRSFVSLVMVLL
jgi:hypothetical protein